MGKYTLLILAALGLRSCCRPTKAAHYRERLALEKEKFQFNAARLAGGHFNEIKAVMADEQTDDEDKIWKIREKIFGPRLALLEPNG